MIRRPVSVTGFNVWLSTKAGIGGSFSPAAMWRSEFM